MIRKSHEREEKIRPQMYEGKGEVLLTSLLNGKDEMYDKGRLFSEITIQPGDNIGYHVHENESETFYIIQGEGEFDDNGAVSPVSVGDVLFTAAGDGHAVRNTGNVPLKMVALILFK